MFFILFYFISYYILFTLYISTNTFTTRAIFGGQYSQNGQKIYFKDLYIFDIRQRAWAAIDAPDGPSNRTGHAAATLTSGTATTMFVYGGRDATQFFNDMYAYTFATASWQRLQTTESWPSRLAFAGVTHFVGSKIGFLMAGGAVDTSYRTSSATWAFFVDSDGGGYWMQLSSNSTVSDETTVARIGQALFLSTTSANTAASTAATAATAADASSGVQAYVFGGRSSTGSYSQTALQINVGCSAGWYSADITSQPCKPCSQGSFSSVAGSSNCTSCPNFISTPKAASTSNLMCNICNAEQRYCIHGSCEVKNQQPVCYCDVGWMTAKCSVPWLGIFLGILFAAIILFAVVFKWHFRKHKQQENYGMELQKQLISAEQVHEMAFTIDWSELDFGSDSVVGTGGSGQVRVCVRACVRVFVHFCVLCVRCMRCECVGIVGVN